MAEQSLTDRILNKLRVKVVKLVADDRNSLCGEPVKTDKEGRQYFNIPAHQAQYVSDLFKGFYEVSEEVSHTSSVEPEKE